MPCIGSQKWVTCAEGVQIQLHKSPGQTIHLSIESESIPESLTGAHFYANQQSSIENYLKLPSKLLNHLARFLIYVMGLIQVPISQYH